MRICSLLPSATEIVFALGQGASLVGVTHECDFPAEAARIPKVTRSNIPEGYSSGEIDQAVSKSLIESGTLYELDLPALEQLQPELVLTQRLCDVCAVSYDRVQDAALSLPSNPRVLNLEPHSLADILDNIVTVGRALGIEAEALRVRDGLQRRVDAVREKSAHASYRPRVFLMEWVDPPFRGGHWLKELVEYAGGRDDLAVLHRPSSRVEWEKVRAFAPEIIVLTCCGFNLARCVQEGAILAKMQGAQEIPALKSGCVYATDGSAYFSRPGPRIVESLEILAHLIHPEIFDPPQLPAAWSRLERAVGNPVK